MGTAATKHHYALNLSLSLHPFSLFPHSLHLALPLSLSPFLPYFRAPDSLEPKLQAYFLSAAFTSCHLMGLPAMPLWSGLEEAPLRGRLPAARTAVQIIPTFRFAQGICLFFTHSCSNVFSFFFALHFVVDFSTFLQYPKGALGSGISVKTFYVCSSGVAHAPKAIWFQTCVDCCTFDMLLYRCPDAKGHTIFE